MIEKPDSYTSLILDSLSEGVFTVDTEWRITSFNRAAELMTGVDRKAAVGRFCWEVFHASVCERGCPLRKTVDTGQPTSGNRIFIIDADGERVPLRSATALLKDASGTVIGGVETFTDLREVTALREALSRDRCLEQMIAKSAVMQKIFHRIEKIAPSDTTVLITGETGTGKELAARAVHGLSLRANGPFAVVDCTALPEHLLESELFGVKKGAFTGAESDRSGRVAHAEGGSLFLDEIGELPLPLQAKLLRLIQEKVYTPLGGGGERPADVRIIAATHRDLEQESRQGRFRQDLFYRLSVIRLHLPPLRERMEDLPLLLDHFMETFSRIHERSVLRLSPEARIRLMRHDYPGNIRELENAVEAAVLQSESEEITPDALPDAIGSSGGQTRNTVPEEDEHPATDLITPAEADQNRIADALALYGGNRSQAAAHLGIHPTTLWRRMKRYGMPSV
ncbi:MAG: Fis family transcriptional regulator [Deltaproteobacteria bacterium]|nr:MAG: Fis family transcriptional regulator [Deltaproteobacteria bacterium]